MLFILIPIAHLLILPRLYTCAPSPCPLNLDYVVKIPWDSSSCKNSAIAAPSNLDDPSSSSTTSCCQTLTSLYGVAFAQHLNNTSLFRLPDLQTSASCLSDFQTELNRLHLRHDLIHTCFDPQRFVNTTDVCAGIQTKLDWVELMGKSTPLDDGCKHDLSGLSACDSCVMAGFRTLSRLLAIDGNDSHSRGCFHYTILYAAGVVHDLGAQSDSALSCIFGLPLISAAGGGGGGGGDRSLVFASIGAGFAAAVVVVMVTCLISFRLKGTVRSLEEFESEEERSLLNWRPKADSLWYEAEEIERVTDNFAAKNLIGKGRFGGVYKGKLGDGSLIAVKKLVDNEFEGDEEFISEVEIISSLRHRNVVPLRGCCVNRRETEKYLVYDYMPNGNLGEHLFPKKRKKEAMSWAQRKSVILDVANALEYLHHGVDPPVYHRDIKPTNILLDSCMRARVADFGLAKRGKDGASHLTTRIAGTHGYLAPEYALYGHLTEKSDVYSFGIVVLEVMCGRKALDFSSSTVLITDWVWPLVKAGKIEEVLDRSLLNERYPEMVMERFVRVGILCAHLMVALRPTILDALRMLEGDIEVPHILDRPLYAPFATGI